MSSLADTSIASSPQEFHNISSRPRPKSFTVKTSHSSPSPTTLGRSKSYREVVWNLFGSQKNTTTATNISPAEVGFFSPTSSGAQPIPGSSVDSITSSDSNFSLSSFPFGSLRRSKTSSPSRTVSSSISPSTSPPLKSVKSTPARRQRQNSIQLVTTTSPKGFQNNPRVTETTILGDWDEDFFGPCSPLTEEVQSSPNYYISPTDLEKYLPIPVSPPPTPVSKRLSFLENNSAMPGINFIDRDIETQVVLTEAVAEQLRPHLPRRYRLAHNWQLVYSLDQHGSSITTLYHKVMGKGPLILAIKDVDDQVFGAFVNEPFKPSPSYYGTGECFLWKNDSTSPEDPRVRVYPWTGRNEYMILCEQGFLAIGGGNGKFGLWLHSDLQRGHSESCPTFDNEPLSSMQEFDCLELEIWGFKL